MIVRIKTLKRCEQLKLMNSQCLPPTTAHPARTRSPAAHLHSDGFAREVLSRPSACARGEKCAQRAPSKNVWLCAECLHLAVRVHARGSVVAHTQHARSIRLSDESRRRAEGRTAGLRTTTPHSSALDLSKLRFFFCVRVFAKKNTLTWRCVGWGGGFRKKMPHIPYTDPSPRSFPLIPKILRSRTPRSEQKKRRALTTATKLTYSSTINACVASLARCFFSCVCEPPPHLCSMQMHVCMRPHTHAAHVL